MNLAVILLLSAQVPALEEDAQLVEILRDAQETNRASLQLGYLRARLENYYRFLDREGRMGLEGEFRWNQSLGAWKIKIIDTMHGQMLLPQPDTDLPEEPRWDYAIRLTDRIASYNHMLNLASIQKRTAIPLFFFEIGPQEAWFVCCPPDGSQGRPWSEMIGHHPARHDLSGSRFSIKRIDSDHIRQVRRDPDGGELTLEFSMAACGNVVSYSYTNGKQKDQGTYRWQQLPDGRCVLRGWDFRYENPPEPGVREMRSTLDIQEIDVTTPVDPSYFNPNALFRQLPDNVILIDKITNQRTRINVKPVKPDTTKELLKLAPRVKSRGFLKR